MRMRHRGDTSTMRLRLVRRAAVCLMCIPGAMALAMPAAAATPLVAAGSGAATVGVASDAWYSASSACTATPTGCLPAAPPASPYPAKTLHAGAAAGQEESRTYLTLDLTALPAGTTLTGGTLRVPVGSSQEGSVAPDTATLQACAVKGSFKDDVNGSTAAPPAVDCKQATSKAKYIAAVGSSPAMFTVDLTPFATAWASGAITQSIVLMPAAGTAPGSTWHVTMSAHDRDVAAPMHISALVTYASMTSVTPAPLQDTTAPPPAPASGTGSASFAVPPLAPIASNQTPTSSVPATTPVSAPQAPAVAPVQRFQPRAAITVGGFRYPAVFLLPILLAVICGWLGRALTRDLQPVAV